MKLAFLGPIVAVWLASSLAPAQATVYTFTTLTIPGSEPSYFGTEAFGINNLGQVLGTYTSDNGLQAFVFDQTSASYTTFADPDSTSGTIAQSINDAGQIVGTIPFRDVDSIFMRDPNSGTFTTIVSLPNQLYPAATAIDNAGLILGFYRNNTFTATTSFLLDPTTNSYTYLQDPNSGNQSMPNFTLANSINNAGQIAGFFEDINGIFNGFVFDPTTGLFTTISNPNASNTFLQGINNSGQVVGYYYADDADQTTQGFVLDLATGAYTLLTDPSGMATIPEGINDAGQIVGYYPNSFYRVPYAFIATPSDSVPVPEPTSFALLGIGVVGLGAIRRWRTKAG